ncbi:MAG: HDIG domain-containing protein [Desulfobulbaceae bacterium]|nr:HDIG domain-containing protein [Desulfobulbaceae bacterium]
MTPTVRECFRLMDEYAMLDNIRAHSVLVGRVAERLACDLVASGVALSVEVAVAGALLHDIAKTPCLHSGGDHAAEGAGICRRHGFEELAAIVGEHVMLADDGEPACCSEKEIVYYADKRVKHDRIVDLDERLQYILDHYGKNDPELRRLIRNNFNRCRQVEARIFVRLGYGPADLIHLVEPVAADTAPTLRWQGVCV